MDPTSLLLVLATLAAGPIGYFLRGRAAGKLPAPVDPTYVPPTAPEIHNFDLGDFSPLLRAVFGNSASAVKREAATLIAKPNQGRPIGTMIKKLMEGLVKQMYAHPEYREYLVAFLGQVLGVDLSFVLKLKASNQAPGPTTVPSSSPVAAPLIALALCLAMGSTALAEPRAPQHFQPTAAVPASDQPLMWQGGKLVPYAAAPAPAQPAAVRGVFGPDGRYYVPAASPAVTQHYQSCYGRTCRGRFFFRRR